MNNTNLFKKLDPGDRELYRRRVGSSDLLRFKVAVKETDLLLLADRDVSEVVHNIVITERDRLEHYMAVNPGFRESLVPLESSYSAPKIVRLMVEAGKSAGVGPMAAVAGAICERIAEEVDDKADDLIIENGGDCLIKSRVDRTVEIYAGEARDRPTFGLMVRAAETPVGVCTSSGRIGHSLSFGDSAAATVIARSCALADAAATAVGNHVRGRDGISAGLARARAIPGVLGVVVIREGRMGACGAVELVRL